MAISEEQSRLMDSQSQPTTGGLGSEMRAFDGVYAPAGVLQGQLNRPLLAKKALISTTLHRQAVERLIEAEREQASRALESTVSVPAEFEGSNLNFDMNGQ
jgi:hypothetical protein